MSEYGGEIPPHESNENEVDGVQKLDYQVVLDPAVANFLLEVSQKLHAYDDNFVDDLRVKITDLVTTIETKYAEFEGVNEFTSFCYELEAGWRSNGAEWAETFFLDFYRSYERSFEYEQTHNQDIQDIIKDFCTQINKGNKGIIFKFDSNDLPDLIKLGFTVRGVEFQGEQVLKLLKISGRVEAGKHEFVMQNEIYKVIEQASKEGSADQYAKIPKAYYWRVVSSSDEEFLNSLKEFGYKGNKSKEKESEEKLIILFMEYLPGKDLSVYLTTELMKAQAQAGEGDLTIEQVNNLSEEELRQIAEEKFGYSFEKMKDKILRNEINFQKHFDSIIELCKKYEVTIPKYLIDQWEKTLDTLHTKANIYHNDNHWRNHYIEENPPGEFQAGLIDFDAADFGINKPSIDDDYTILALRGIQQD